MQRRDCRRVGADGEVRLKAGRQMHAFLVVAADRLRPLLAGDIPATPIQLTR